MQAIHCRLWAKIGRKPLSICSSDHLFSNGGLNAEHYKPRKTNSKLRRKRGKVTHLQERVAN